MGDQDAGDAIGMIGAVGPTGGGPAERKKKYQITRAATTASATRIVMSSRRSLRERPGAGGADGEVGDVVNGGPSWVGAVTRRGDVQRPMCAHRRVPYLSGT